MPQFQVRWDDSLPPFAGPGSDLPEIGYAIEAMAERTNTGNPQSIIEVIRSLLTDGSLAVLEGWDNREAAIRLRVSAPTRIAGPALADAEKALMGAVLAESKAPLVYVPAAQDSATCVFDVVAAELTKDVDDGWDLDELDREYRYYLLTLTCLPFARTEQSVVVPALAPPEPPEDIVEVMIDDCSSAVGWTAPNGGSVTVSSGTVNNTKANWGGASLQRNGAVVLGATPYVRVRAGFRRQPNPWQAPSGITRFNGVLTEPVAIAQVSANEWDMWFLPGDFATVSIILTPAGPSTFSDYVMVSEIARTNSVGDGSTTRQQARSATVAGSAPTQAAIRLYDATPAPLGSDVLVYSQRGEGFRPNLRDLWLVDSEPTAPDAAMVSGSRNTLATEMVFRIPAAALSTGTYAVTSRLKTTGETVAWSARTVAADGSTTIGSAIEIGGSTNLTSTSSAYKVVSLGAAALPVIVAEGDQMVELTIAGTAQTTVDEVWLFNLDDGVLTWVNAPDVEWIEIRSPELGAARPSVYGGIGTAGENGICIDWACESFGAHRFDPGVMQIFTVATTSLVTQSEIEFYPRYHSHVEGSSAP